MLPSLDGGLARPSRAPWKGAVSQRVRTPKGANLLVNMTDLVGHDFGGMVCTPAETSEPLNEDWDLLVSFLPDNWEELARKTGALRKLRKDKSLSNLLRSG